MSKRELHRTKALSQVFCSALTVLGLVVLAQRSLGADIEPKRIPSAATPVFFVLESDDATARAHPRLNLSAAIDERKELLKHHTSVSFVAENGTEIVQWGLRLKDKPEWVVYEVRWGEAHAAVSLERILEHLTKLPITAIPAPQTCRLLSSQPDKYGVERATTDCLSKGGYHYDVQSVARAVKTALEAGEKRTTVVLTTVEPSVLDTRVAPEGRVLTLLGRGVSDFKGSGLGRKANVRKAIGEKVNGVVVPPDSTFSFNSMLGGSVGTGNGWQMALVIFDGKNLEPAPGGGICQASTTTYRAVLAAGFPIVTQKNHSLYVHYYEHHGVGQDATVFPGKQDLTFINDTGSPVFLQAHYEGEKAFVEIYGVHDGRRVAMEGPFFGKTAPPDIQYKGRPLRNNEIAWRRTVHQADGQVRSEVFVSRYTAIPKSLSSKYAAETTVSPPMHAAAGEPKVVAEN